MLTAKKFIEEVNSGDTLTQEELFPLFARASYLVNDCVRLLLRENCFVQLRVVELGAEVAANLDRNKAIFRRNVEYIDDQLKDVQADPDQRQADFLCACMDLQMALLQDDQEAQLDIVLSLPLTRMVFEQIVKEWTDQTRGYQEASLRGLAALFSGDMVALSSADAECHAIERQCFLEPRTAYGVIRYVDNRLRALKRIYDRVFAAYSRVILKLAKAQAVSEDHSLDCLAGDSLVWTDRGVLRIDELVPCDVQTTFGTKEAFPHFPEVKVRPTVRAKTRLGLSLTSTPDHKIKVLNEDTQELEWISVHDSEGRYVLVATGSGLGWPSDPSIDFDPPLDGLKRQAHVPLELSPPLASLMGYLVSEGTVFGPDSSNAGSVGFANSDPDIISDYLASLECSFGISGVTPCLRDSGVTELVFVDHNANDILRHLGCDYVYSENKVVPWSVMRGSKESVVSFLRSYWEGDGSLVDRPSCGSKSEQLMIEIQQLLLRLGILSKRTTVSRHTDYHGNPTDVELRMHILTITNAQDARKFLDVVGYTSARSAEEVAAWGSSPSVTSRKRKLTDSQVRDIWQMRDDGASYASLGRKFGVTAEYVSQISRGRDKYRGNEYTPTTGYSMDRCKRNMVPGASPRKTASKTNRHAYFCDLDDSSPLKKLEGQFVFDLVESVEDAGELQVYDISVEDVHEFVVNGEVSHNCFQNGSFGLLRAVSSYDHVSNARFVGHARWWIRQSMLLHLKENSNIIRVSSNTWQHYAKLEDIRRRHESQHGPLDNKKLAQISDYSENHIDSIYGMVRASQVRSLDHPVKPDGSSTLMTFVDSSTEEEPADFTAADSVNVLLGNLPAKLRNLVCLNFGLTEYVEQDLDPAQVELERKKQQSYSRKNVEPEEGTPWDSRTSMT